MTFGGTKPTKIALLSRIRRFGTAKRQISIRFVLNIP